MRHWLRLTPNSTLAVLRAVAQLLVVRFQTHAMKPQSVFVFLTLVLLDVGCGPHAITSSVAGDSANDTWRLDTMAQRDSKAAQFADSVKKFYRAIEEQDWSTTYDMRVAEFKQDVSRDDYLKQMAEDGKRWHLDSYKVLNVTTFAGPTGDDQAAEIIMQFNEDGSVSYASARWKKRFGK